MHPDLETLLRLQEKDEQVEEAEKSLEALNPERDALAKELEQAEAAVEAALAGVEDATRRRDELEGKIHNYRAMQERKRERLEFVRGAKEASALMAEIDLARTVMIREEAEWVRSSDSVVAAQHTATQAKQALEEISAAQTPKRVALESQFAELEARIQSARSARAAVAGDVKRKLLELYDRIRRGKGARVLYALHGEACGRCFTAVPLHRRSRIERGESIENCEGCGAILFAE